MSDSDNPFEVGKKYKNHIGRYQVAAIEPPKMLVRYEDGREQILTIETQARIWSNMAIDKRAAKKKLKPAKESKKVRRSRSWTNRGYEFKGLKESDFKNSISHTTWRSRQSLGGLLALQVSEATKQFFQSYAVARRPQVHIYLPDYFDPQNGIPYAKLELRLDETTAYTRFYVEKSDKIMDKKWHWHNFLHALHSDKKLPKQILNAMADHGLRWEIEFEHENVYQPHKTIHISAGQPLLRQDAEGSENIDWTRFVTEIMGLPKEDWCNVYFGRSTPKEEALETAERFGDLAVEALLAALPVYLATIERPSG